MKNDTKTIEAELKAATEANPLDAFEAGLKSQVPSEILPGIIAHHKDIAISDKTRETLLADKRTVPGPVNPAGTLTLLTAESFAAAVVDHADKRTQIFADAGISSITAVFDLLEKGGAEVGTDTRERGWGQLRAAIKFEESRKLKEWRKTLEWMCQMDFANFLEDHLEDVVTPSGQDLLTIATDLEASSQGNFKGRVNLDNGSVALTYQNETETSVEIPRHIVLGIPLFEHGDRYKLSARLRFVVSGGSVKFRLLFTNLQDAKEQEFERIVQGIEEKTSRTIYRGRLELLW